MERDDGDRRAGALRLTIIAVVAVLAGIAAGVTFAPGAVASIVGNVRAGFLDIAGQTAADAPTEPTATTPRSTPTPSETTPPVPRHRVRIATRPRGADVTITPAGGGPLLTGTSPFTARVPEGVATLSITRRGRQPLERRLAVERDRKVRWWLDPRGQLHHKVAQFETGSAPKQVAFTPDRRELWVTLLGGPGVEVFQPRTGRRLATIDLGDHGAVEVIFTADGSTAYVSQMESASVYEIDTASHEVTRQLSTEASWTKVLALSPDESTLYASNWSSNDVSEIDLGSGDVVRRLPTVATPRGLFVTPDGDTLYVAGFDGGQLQRIELRDGSSEILETTGGAMRHLVGDPDRGRLYADDMGADTVFVHDLDRRRVRRLTATDEKPNTIDLGADGRVLYVSNRGENNAASYYLPGPEWGSVLIFDAATGEPLDAIVGGNQTTGLDVSEDGRLLAFSDFLDNRVQVYEVPPHDVLAAGDGGRFGRHRRDLAKGSSP
ncbi:MAG TPA: YncE family protein [Euzebyales bacterium]|nr:YncE family protein [Euzebyales bacterium]